MERPTIQPFAWADDYLSVGVTGTNGKTTTVHLLSQIVRVQGLSLVTESTLGYSFNNEELDVSRSMDGLMGVLKSAHDRGCRNAVIEVTSESLGKGCAKYWRFDHAVFTNLTRDHLDSHGSFEHYLASKAQLFVHLGPGATACFNAGDETSLLLDGVTPKDVKRLWYGVTGRSPLAHETDLSGEARVSPRGTHIVLAQSVLADRLDRELDIPLVGSHFAENALAAACAAFAIGMSPESIRTGLSTCPIVPGRFQVLNNDPLIAVDFAHSPDALERTCDTAREIAGRGRVIVVFGAGGNRDQGKREPMGRVVGDRADLAIVTTDNPRNEDPDEISRTVSRGCRRGGRARVVVEPDRRSAIAMALREARSGDVVIVAGKGHESGQTIGSETTPFSDVEEIRKLLPLHSVG